MKRFKKKLFILLVSALSFSISQAESKKPNIIFIFADDWGWGDLSCHGHELFKTPFVDQLSKEGTNFSQFYVNAAVCSPSRTSVMTGQFPARHSVHTHFSGIKKHKGGRMPDWLDPDVVMLPRLFQQAGYKTAHFGKWHLTNTAIKDAPLPTEYGYDESAVHNGPGPQVDGTGLETCNKTIEFIKKNKEEPFFINVWLHQTHLAHFPKERFLKQFEQLDERNRVYAAVVAEADYGVGQIMKTLDELNLSDNTLIAFSSDNGPEGDGRNKTKPDKMRGGLGRYFSMGSTGGLRGYKSDLYEGGVRVPFIVRWPGKVPVGKLNETTVLTAVDLLPTFCKAAGIALPEGYQSDGENMLKAFMGEDGKRTKEIYWQRGSGLGKPKKADLAVREGDWKLLMSYDGTQKELYNIVQDRAEKNNLVQKHPERADRLAEQIMNWRKTLPEEPPQHCLSAGRNK